MQEITSLNDLKDYTGLVLFTATWCTPCRTYRPMLEKFAADRRIALRFVDAGKRPDLAGTYGVRGVPTTFFFVNGSPFSQRQGIATASALELLLPEMHRTPTHVV